jgi:hypothetical protein
MVHFDRNIDVSHDVTHISWLSDFDRSEVKKFDGKRFIISDERIAIR